MGRILQFERIHAWLGVGHTLHQFEPSVGGVADFSIDLDGSEEHFGGPVITVDPQAELTFEVRWNNPAMDAGGPMHWSYLDGAEVLDYESAWQPNHLARLSEIILA